MNMSECKSEYKVKEKSIWKTVKEDRKREEVWK